MRLRVRQLGWGIAIGVVATLASAWASFKWSDGIAAAVARAASTPEGRAAAATALLGLVQAVATLAAALLAGLVAELPAAAGAIGGLVAVLLPALVLAVAAGPEEIGGAPGLVRIAAALASAVAGALGVRLLSRQRQR